MSSFPCPTCGKAVGRDRENPYRPFCCERCRLIDLGAWAEGKYAIDESRAESFSDRDRADDAEDRR